VRWAASEGRCQRELGRTSYVVSYDTSYDQQSAKQQQQQQALVNRHRLAAVPPAAPTAGGTGTASPTSCGGGGGSEWHLTSCCQGPPGCCCEGTNTVPGDKVSSTLRHTGCQVPASSQAASMCQEAMAFCSCTVSCAMLGVMYEQQRSTAQLCQVLATIQVRQGKQGEEGVQGAGRWGALELPGVCLWG
jgi:hypothetical protein